MEVEVRGKFYIIAIRMNGATELASQTGENFCVVKGILGSKQDLDNTKLSRLSTNSITTLLINKEKHGESITRIKTGSEVTIIGHIDYHNKSFHPIYVKKINTLKTN